MPLYKHSDITESWMHIKEKSLLVNFRKKQKQSNEIRDRYRKLTKVPFQHAKQASCNPVPGNRSFEPNPTSSVDRSLLQQFTSIFLHQSCYRKAVDMVDHHRSSSPIKRSTSVHQWICIRIGIIRIKRGTRRGCFRTPLVIFIVSHPVVGNGSDRHLEFNSV